MEAGAEAALQGDGWSNNHPRILPQTEALFPPFLRKDQRETRINVMLHHTDFMALCFTRYILMYFLHDCVCCIVTAVYTN